MFSLWKGEINAPPRHSKFDGFARRGSLASLRRMLADFAADRGVCLSDLTGPRRARIYSWTRQEFMWIAYQTGDYSTTTIGQVLNRDHATVLHGIHAHRARMMVA